MKQLVEMQLAITEALRRLGFAAANIDSGVDSTGHAFVKLSPPGQPEFIVDFPGSPTVDYAEFNELSKRERHRWNTTMPDEEGLAIYRRHITEGVLMVLVLKIMDKGITVPNVPRRS
jgi:hypothetical protein